MPWKDKKEVAADLRKIYTTANESAASAALESFREKLDKSYLTIDESWQRNWQGIVNYVLDIMFVRVKKSSSRKTAVQLVEGR